MSNISNSASVHKVFVTLYASERNPIPTHQCRLDLAKLSSLFDSHDIREKKSGRAFALHELTPGSSRANGSVLAMSGCIADVDQGPTYEQVLPEVADLLHYAYSTHSNDPSQGKHKFRLVFPFTSPVTPSDYPKVWDGINQRLGGIMDPQCKDLARLHYLPSCPSHGQTDAFAIAHQGELLDPATLLVPSIEKKLVTSPVMEAILGLQTLEAPQPAEVKQMLAHIDPFCDRKDWMDILFALASTYGLAGEDLARRWSRGDLWQGGRHAG